MKSETDKRGLLIVGTMCLLCNINLKKLWVLSAEVFRPATVDQFTRLVHTAMSQDSLSLFKFPSSKGQEPPKSNLKGWELTKFEKFQWQILHLGSHHSKRYMHVQVHIPASKQENCKR